MAWKAPRPRPGSGTFHGFVSLSVTGPRGGSTRSSQEEKAKTIPTKSIRRLLIGAAAAARHRKHLPPVRGSACSKGSGSTGSAGPPACEPPPHPPSYKMQAAARRSRQGRLQGIAWPDNKKAPAACKLAEASKFYLAGPRLSSKPVRPRSRGHPAGCARPEREYPYRSPPPPGRARSRKASPCRSGGPHASPAASFAG